MDEATLAAMPTEERMQYLGNGLYPRVQTLVGDGLAGKITGMLLEMATPEVLGFFSDGEALKSAVEAAVGALPPDMLDMLGQVQPIPDASMPPEAEMYSPANPSPVSVMAGQSALAFSGWADCDEDDEDEMPSVGEMFASAERKRAENAAAADDAMEEDEADDGFVCSWNFEQMSVQAPDVLCTFIAEQLQEPQVRIVRAVVELLGSPAALDLLYTTERCVHRGGMIVEETGKPRSPGGIFLKLLKDATNLEPEAQHACLARIKKEGADAKKALQKARDAKRNPHLAKMHAETATKAAHADEQPMAASPERYPKPTILDFITPKLSAAR